MSGNRPPANEALLASLGQIGERMERVERVLANHVEHLGQKAEHDGVSPVVWILVGAGAGFVIALLLGAGGESAPARVGSSLGTKILETGATTLLRKGLSKL